MFEPFAENITLILSPLPRPLFTELGRLTDPKKRIRIPILPEVDHLTFPDPGTEGMTAVLCNTQKYASNHRS